MTDYCLLPKYRALVDCPNDLTEEEINREGWGWTDEIGKKITIPWLTLRYKGEFFNTVAHEASHISAYEVKFNLKEKKIIEKHSLMLEKGNILSREYETHYRKNQALIKEWNYQGGHWYDTAYLHYRDYFNKLLNSPFSQYAYNQRNPLSYEVYSK
jgi:hypothetical protein